MKKSIIAATVLALMASTANAGIVPSGEWLLPPAQGSEPTSAEKQVLSGEWQLPPAQVSKPTSAWSQTVKSDAMTDEKQVFLSVSSSDYTDEYGGVSGIRMSLRCMDNTTSLVLATSEFVSSTNGGGKVTYRVDKNEAVTVNMRSSTNNKALALWSGSKAIPAIKSMFGGKTLTVKFAPYSASYITVTFDITGIESEITELRETCNW